MNFGAELQVAADQVISSPKTLASVSVATASLGAAGYADIAQGALSMLAIIVGIVATLLLGRVHWAKYKNEVLQNKILKKQLIDMGITEFA